MMPCKSAAPVLFIGNFLSSTGASRGVSEELSDRLACRGWSIFTTSRRRARVPRLLDMLATIWNLRRSFRVAHVDLYSGSAFLWAEAACALLRGAHRPYILTLHGGGLPEFGREHEPRLTRLLNSATAVTAPSGYLKEELSPYRPGIVLLPNALDLRRYEFRLRTSVRPNLIWVRAFHDVYNPVLAVQTAALLAPEFPELQLTMIGPDKGDGSRARAGNAATNLGIADRVKFVGPVPKTDVPRYINQGDIFLNTSRVDNTPVTLLEAMACGVPVVSTDVCGIPYLVQPDGEALLVPSGHPLRMAHAVRCILTEPDLAGRLSLAGRRRAEAFDWQSILPQWEHLLEECIES